MKSSVLFLFANDYVRVFRNGKVQIPGVSQYIKHSTLFVTLAKIQTFFQLYLQLHTMPRILHLYAVMINYKTALQIPARLSVRKIINLIKLNTAHFNATDFVLSHCIEIRNRPVLLLKYRIDKVVY